MSQGYRGLEAEWHDLFWEDEEAPSELPFLEEFLEGVTGRALYAGSGSGRLLGPLVEAGHAVTGLEVSSEMVVLSKERWPKAEVMEKAWGDADGEWGAILLPGFTFQLFEHPGREFRRMRELVKTGGKAYVSLFFPWAEVSGELPQGVWYHDRDLKLPDGLTGEMRTRHFLDDKASVLKREHRYRLKSADGNVLREDRTKQRVRIFADGELEKMIEKAGWRLGKEIQNFGEEDEDDVVYVITLFLEAV
ncbi:MAG: class I SAM-dependent methyltransferase [Verrucomicrobiaceae bacterium]